jgi:hypothetical protein
MRTFARPKIDDDDPAAMIAQPVRFALQVRQFKIRGWLIDLHGRIIALKRGKGCKYIKRTKARNLWHIYILASLRIFPLVKSIA